MLQVRIAEFDGSNPVILERVEKITEFKALSSSDEGIKFEIAKNAPKASVLDPSLGAESRRWELWDTAKNERVNYGPLTGSISEQGPKWSVEAEGRSSLLKDFYKNKKTFYASVYSIVDDIRYENVAIQPRTTTVVHDTTPTVKNIPIFGSISVNEKYHGLSTNTKDNIIDDNDGLFKVGEIQPKNTYYTTDSYWAGMSKNDSIVIDLGQPYDISKITVSMPWWGGPVRLNNRTYDYRISYALDTGVPTFSGYQGRVFGPFTTLFDTGANSKLGAPPGKPTNIYLGLANSGIGVDIPTFYRALSTPGTYVPMRYIRAHVYNVHAWFGSLYDSSPPIDGWAYQCDPNYDEGDTPGLSGPSLMEGKVISDTILESQNDCYASVVEVGAFKEIIGRGTIKPLVLQRIDNNNLQITYHHVPEADEMEDTDSGFVKFEPGGFFRKFAVSYSGASSTYTKFYDDDCSNCYPDGFNFGIVDHNNSLILSRDSTSGTSVPVTAGVFTKHILMKGASNATITSVDSWPSISDTLSWGGSYSYTEVENDYAIIHFKGESFKWYATIPEGKTGAQVNIQIRNKNSSGAWTSYSTLETNYQLPSGVSSSVVYEITYESGLLQSNTVYQIRITNANGGYCSIDSIEGYWEGSMTQYNEDSPRVGIFRPEHTTQIYDNRFSAGSMYKWNKSGNFVAFEFIGDRFILLSAKGRNHGKLSIAILNLDNGNYYDPDISGKVPIPGGDVDGTLTLDLGTGIRGNEIPQYVLMDSNDYFTSGLKWGRYAVSVALIDTETYNTNDVEIDTNNFVYRCQDCNPPTGNAVTVNKFVFFDGFLVHEQVGLSVDYENETHLDILKSVAEVTQMEWEVTEEGISMEPRIGVDTDIVLREGHNTLVSYNIVNDLSQIATMLVSSGADIEGLPLFTITEDKKTRARVGRTIMRKHDFRNIASYEQLIGLSRGELKRRSEPDRRITVTHTGDVDLNIGDTFILATKKSGPLRVRVDNRFRHQDSSSGTTIEMECSKWPRIV